jgi:Arylsulfotransferase (ASST)
LTTVDQQKIRRSRTGLIAHDPVLAQPGYTLFAPMYGDGTVYLIDMEGKVAHTWHMPYRPWEVRHPDHHHDARRLRNGNVILLCLRPLPAEVVSRVQRGLSGTEAAGMMYGDYLAEMTTSGDVVWEWRSWEHLDPVAHPITPHKTVAWSGLTATQWRKRPRGISS